MADAEMGVREKRHQLCCEHEARGKLAVTAQEWVSPSLGPCEGVRVGGKSGCATFGPRNRGRAA